MVWIQRYRFIILVGSNVCLSLGLNVLSIRRPFHAYRHMAKTAKTPLVDGSILYRRATALSATKKSNRKVSPTGSTSGFGGAAVAPCDCGAGLSYSKCCGRLHRDAQAYAQASAEAVVRARYTAYAKRAVDFIMESTHPLNYNFMEDIQHWRTTIEANCYDDFVLQKCEILDESYVGDEAKVRFLAHLTHRKTGERTAFIETSTFRRHPETGAWLYRDGIIESAGDAESNET